MLLSDVREENNDFFILLTPLLRNQIEIELNVGDQNQGQPKMYSVCNYLHPQHSKYRILYLYNVGISVPQANRLALFLAGYTQYRY